MRTKLEIIDINENVIFVSEEIAQQLDNPVSVCFGSLSVKAQVKVINPSLEHNENKSDSINEDLERITISDRLKKQLFIQEDLIYLVRLLYSQIVIGPVVGLLLRSHKKYKKTRVITKNCYRLSYFKNMGGLICKFSYKNIHFGSKIVEGQYYNPDNSTWEPGILPLPKVIYLRTFRNNTNKNIEVLKKITDNKVYNSFRFNKFQLYQYLSEDSVLCNYLPVTEVCSSIPQILSFIKKYKNIILKPIDLSRGRGICIIQNIGSCYKIIDYRKNNANNYKLVTDKALTLFLRNNKSFLRKYIIQDHIPLAQIDGYPYDVRVVMQKTSRNNWELMGIECRVSRSSLITNISRGGYALTIENAIARSFNNADYNQIQKQIQALCHKLCLFIEQRTGEHYAELGIDIGLDINKNLWIIEANVLPSYNGFKDIDYNLYKLIRTNPIQYAVSLTEFKDSIVREALQE